MLVRTYGIYDGVAKEFIRTFTSKNDESAERAVQYIVKEPGFDKIAGKDWIVNYLFSMESETGDIVDVNKHVVCAFATYMVDEPEQEIKDGGDKAL